MEPSPVLCPGCQEAMAAVTLQVWHGHVCYRCKTSVPVIDMVVARWESGEASDEDLADARLDAMALAFRMRDETNVIEAVLEEMPRGAAGPAGELGVLLTYRYSKVAGRPYLMHLCPACGATQGNFYVYDERYGDWWPDPEHPVQVAPYWWCPECDIWAKRELQGVIDQGKMPVDKTRVTLIESHSSVVCESRRTSP